MEIPFPKYEKRLDLVRYTYSQSSPLKFSSIWKKCILLPGCKAVIGPSAVPFLNHDVQGPAQVVRGMKTLVCSKSSSTAALLGEIALMRCVWHFRMMPEIYFAMSSTIVKTLPWPIGAFGPRNTGLPLADVLPSNEYYPRYNETAGAHI